MTRVRMMVGALVPSMHPGCHIAQTPEWPQTTWAIFICFVHLGHGYESMFEELCFKAKRLEIARLSLS